MHCSLGSERSFSADLPTEYGNCIACLPRADNHMQETVKAHAVQPHLLEALLLPVSLSRCDEWYQFLDQNCL